MREVVPEEHGAGPPFGSRPAAQMGDAAISGVEHGECERTVLWIVSGRGRVRHVEALQKVARRTAILVDSAVLLRMSR